MVGADVAGVAPKLTCPAGLLPNVVAPKAVPVWAVEPKVLAGCTVPNVVPV